jgi:hypothetical protein
VTIVLTSTCIFPIIARWPDFSAHLSFELFSTQPPTPSLWQSFLSPFWDSAPGPSHCTFCFPPVTVLSSFSLHGG